MTTPRLLLWIAMLLALAGSVLLSLQRGFMVLLAAQVWGGF